MITRSDYQSALDVQSAVNLSGVVFSFTEIMRRICEESQRPSRCIQWKNQWRNYHPICRLFAETIAERSGAGGPSDLSVGYVRAYEFCEKASAEKPAHLAITLPSGEVLEYEVKGDE